MSLSKPYFLGKSHLLFGIMRLLVLLTLMGASEKAVVNKTHFNWRGCSCKKVFCFFSYLGGRSGALKQVQSAGSEVRLPRSKY